MRSPTGPMPATTVSCERSCRRSRPRRTAVRNLSRFVSSVARIPSAQSSISSRVSRAWRRDSSMISCACRSANLTISVCEASRTACSRASWSSRSCSRFASASIYWRSLTIHRACLISSGIVARIWSRMWEISSRSIRTGSVRGTAFALCTRSSSLSMRTSTSIGPRMLLLLAERCPASTVREHLLQAPRDRVRNQFLDVSTERRDLLHPARGHEADLRTRHHVDRLDLRREVAVELVHLELPLEIRDDAQALDDHLRFPAAREVDDELLEDVHLDVPDRCQLVAQELDPLLDREHRLLVVRIADDADDDAVEDPRRARDHVDVPVRDRVVRAGVDGGDQRAKRVMRAAPYLREVRISSPSISGCVRAPLSYTTRPSSVTIRGRCGAIRSCPAKS